MVKGKNDKSDDVTGQKVRLTQTPENASGGARDEEDATEINVRNDLIKHQISF